MMNKLVSLVYPGHYEGVMGICKCKFSFVAFSKNVIFLVLFGYFVSKMLASVEKLENKGGKLSIFFYNV